MTSHLKKMEAMISVGQQPSYDDLIEGFGELMNHCDSLNKMIASMSKEIALIILPRVSKKPDVVVIAALDDFIKRKTIAKTEMH